MEFGAVILFTGHRNVATVEFDKVFTIESLCQGL